MPHQELYIDGVYYPSVTTILAVKPMPWLSAWKEKWGVLAERKTKIASAIGTEFHRCVEQWLDTRDYTVMPPTVDGVAMPSTMPRVAGMMRSWIKWAMGVDGVILETEVQVVSRAYLYSGTLDALGILNGRRVVIDWKTSSRIYDDMQLQLSAYSNAYNEGRPNGTLVKDGLIVHTSKDKPHFRVTTKAFKLGKRTFNKFLALRDKFDDLQAAIEGGSGC